MIVFGQNYGKWENSGFFFRQRECAFWTEYLPSVVLYITPTYPPTTEVREGGNTHLFLIYFFLFFSQFWWEPDSPLQIAFWSVCSACLALVVLVVVCCLLWRNAERWDDFQLVMHRSSTYFLKKKKKLIFFCRKVKDMKDDYDMDMGGSRMNMDSQNLMTDR